MYIPPNKTLSEESLAILNSVRDILNQYMEEDHRYIPKKIDYIPEGYEEYKCINGKTYLAPHYCCLFCKHCTDVFCDDIHGPYALCCECDSDRDAIMNRENDCDNFERGM